MTAAHNPKGTTTTVTALDIGTRAARLDDRDLIDELVEAAARMGRALGSDDRDRALVEVEVLRNQLAVRLAYSTPPF